MLQTNHAKPVVINQPAPPRHIAIFAEQRSARIPLVRLLQESGYTLSIPDTIAELQVMLADATMDIIILVFSLDTEYSAISDMSALLRSNHPVPMMVISPIWNEEQCISCLDSGADEYLSKPFSRSEFMARIRALLRRSHAPSTIKADDRHQIFEFDGWKYRTHDMDLTSPTGSVIGLTAAEHDLLLAFLNNPQRIIARERLLEIARTRIAHPSDRSVDVLVSRLRRKLGGKSSPRALIKTAHGQGYMLSASVSFY